MMRFTPRSRAWTAWLSLVVGACGMEGGSTPPADANTDTCRLVIVSIRPDSPLAPVTLQLEAVIERDGWLTGIETFQWEARSPSGALVATTPQDADGRSVAFPAAQAGPYAIRVAGAIAATECDAASVVVNVGVDGAPTALYRLRMVPEPGQGAPPQEQIVEIPGGADYELGTLTLSTGVRATGTVSATDVGPVAAYLRATPSGGAGQAALETFAGPSGAFELRLESRDHDILVVPVSNDVAPALVRGVNRVSGFDLALAPGIPVRGAVTVAGQPVAGARVALRVDGVPSTLGVAGADGAFAVLARGGAAALTVVPPEPSGLPRLALEPGAGLEIGTLAVSGLAIAYAPELAPRTIAPQVMLFDGVTTASFARVTWITASMLGAGELTGVAAGPVALTGSVRASQVAGADGVLPELALPAALYDVIIEPVDVDAAQSVTWLRVDLGPGMPEPARLVLAPAARVRGVLAGHGGEPLAGARVSASPTGLLGGATAASATATTGSDGGFSLLLPGSGDYELTIAGADARHERARLAIQAPAAGQQLDLGTLTLRPALRVSGRVAIAGTPGTAGVILQLLCLDCGAGDDESWPVAEAVSDGAGRFVLAAPDPAATP